ncbi:MAG: SufD family Fe-S cluster assembly protein [Candidatus Marsarchaeota archaeon]|nr:SufD family Fe-S cluster assembly protein [Candidatus Marsarchaeota archaeon]MCL5102289.1 SufD family Fe-S cluster assembly protein [Candidatus Marsarchaeota archaeon]
MPSEEQQEQRTYAKGYTEVPFENDQLYKKYFVNLDLKKFEIRKELETVLKGYDDNIISSLSKRVGIKFDVVIYNGAIAKGSKFMSIGSEETRSAIESMVPVDRLVAFSHDFSCETIRATINENGNLNILFYNDGNFNPPASIFFEVKKGVTAALNEFFLSGENNAESLNAAVQAFRINESAHIEISEIHAESEKTISMVTRTFNTGDNSSLDFNAFYTGGAAGRQRSVFYNSGYGSIINSNEAVIGTGSQKFDLNTRMVNLKPKSVCNYEIRTVLADESYGVVKSLAKMQRDAEGSESHIEEKGLIYDKNARIVMMPDMSIDESYVKASHSSSTSPIPDDDIFYLSSRGMDKDQAKFLVGSGLIYELLKKIKNQDAKSLSMLMAKYRLESRHVGLPSEPLKNFGVWYE